MTTTTPPKIESAAWEYSYDFKPYLQENELIIGYGVDVRSGTLRVDHISQDAEKVIFWVSGGTRKTVAVLEPYVTTSQGRRYPELFNIPII